MKKNQHITSLLTILLIASFLSACNSQADRASAAGTPESLGIASREADTQFTLKTAVADGHLVYTGVGGEIDGIVNPDLIVEAGSIIRLTLVNGDGMQHDLFLPDFNTKTAFVAKIDDQTEIVFEISDKPSGTYAYYCTVSGHRQAGQEGKLIVSEP